MAGETENTARVLSRSKRRGGQSDRSAPMESLGSGELNFPQLVQEAIQELSRKVRGSSFGAWWGRVGLGTPECFASQRPPSTDPVEPLEAHLFASLARLDQASDLGARSFGPELLLFSKRSGCSAAVALKAGGDSREQADVGVLVLAVGSPEDAPGTVRPRTLAALEETREKLQAAFDQHSALDRLAPLNETIDDLNRRAALGELITEIVHEVRNPLVSVKTFLELLPGRLNETDFVEDFREVVLGEVARLERLLDTALQQARPRKTEPAAHSADVKDSFERIGRLVSHRAREREIHIEN
ncbi:hypothetical protein MK280_08020, partial [Myxococcota bacterium]|nr:hypothetical protein [Myxococcota bacterium]